MKQLLATAVITALVGAGGAFAQTTAPLANPNASTPAVANSFTEAQAKSRIEKAGYTNVSGLSKDKDGIWKGKASKAGTSVDVGVDYQGNVVAK